MNISHRSKNITGIWIFNKFSKLLKKRWNQILAYFAQVNLIFGIFHEKTLIQFLVSWKKKNSKNINFIFGKLEKLKKPEFVLFKAKKNSKKINFFFFFGKQNELKKHDVNFWSAKKKRKKHKFCLQLTKNSKTWV